MYTNFLPFCLTEDVNSAEQNVWYLRHKTEDVKEVNLIYRRIRRCVCVGHVVTTRWRHWCQLVLHEVLQHHTLNL